VEEFNLMTRANYSPFSPFSPLRIQIVIRRELKQITLNSPSFSHNQYMRAELRAFNYVCLIIPFIKYLAYTHSLLHTTNGAWRIKASGDSEYIAQASRI